MRDNTAELDIQHQIERQEQRRVESRRATQRLIGSYALGGIAAWKILTYEPVIHADGEVHGFPWLLAMWIVLALLAFGLASWDQIAKAVRRP